jgi:hypothetical protein
MFGPYGGYQVPAKNDNKIGKEVLKRAKAVTDQDDYYVEQWRCHFPACPGHLEELWFRGRYRGNNRMKIAGDDEMREYAVFLHPDETGYVLLNERETAA